MKAFLGRRYRLRLWVARAARLTGTIFPHWRAPKELADCFSYVRSCYGPFLLNTPGDKTFSLCVEGYGRLLSDAVASRGRPFLFLDIEANLGLFSLLAAANPRCEGVVAIEPLPMIHRNLEANIRRNGARNVVAVRGAVAATMHRVVHLAFDRSNSGLSRIVPRERGSIEAPVISAALLDELLPEARVGIIAVIPSR